MRAVDWAADEAVLRKVPLRLVYASLWERYEGAALAETLGTTANRRWRTTFLILRHGAPSAVAPI